VRRFQAVVGIDPSGGRLSVVAVRGVMGTPTAVLPPLSHEFRSEREDGRFGEAEGVLGDFVARNGLVGARAFLVLPADAVHMARAVFPPMREKDLREAVGLELERLIPLAPSAMRHAWRKLPDTARDGKFRLVVAAAPLDYLDRWEETVSRVGLTLEAAVPAAWAIAAAMSRFGVPHPPEGGALSLVLRWIEGRVECTVLAGGEAVFCSSRPASPASASSEGISLAMAGLTDVFIPEEEARVDLVSPAGWFPPGEFRPGAAGFSFRVREGLPQAVAALSVAGGPEGPADPLPFLGSYGAAVGGRSMDLLAPQRTGEISRLARAAVALSAAATVALGIAWPAAVAWKANTDLRRLDAQIAALRPYAEAYEETIADLDDIQAKVAILRGEMSATGETLQVLKELTDRLPNGSWILSLRVEGSKVDLEGLSSSASEIFPALTRDGRFRSVEFAAPITRQADNIERFKIRGEYVPPSVVPPPPGSAR
jgi:hypothetical protein